jgi:hypothetical protein
VGSWRYFHGLPVEPGRSTGRQEFQSLKKTVVAGRSSARRVQRIGRSSPLDGQAAAKGLNVDTRIKQAPTNARHHSRTRQFRRMSPVLRSYTRRT